MMTAERRDASTIIAETRSYIDSFVNLLDQLSGTIDELEAETRRQRCDPEHEGRQ